MQTKKATALNDFLNDVVRLFVSILENRELENEDLSVSKSDLTEEKFTEMYTAFEVELGENIVEYNDIDMASDYIRTCLSEFDEWVGFGQESNSYIIQKGNEVSLLLKTRQQIDIYKNKIYRLLDDKNSFKSYDLIRIFDKVTEPELSITIEIEPIADDRFIFEKMLVELTEQNKTTLETIGFINDRLCEFKKWQLVSDTQYEYDFCGKVDKTNHRYSKKHYCHFEKLCGLEIDKQQNRYKLEKAELTQKAIENNPVIIQNTTSVQMQWASTDMDLVELIGALHQAEAIKRKDGKPLTRKELIEYFQQLFAIEIKRVEVKLTKATGRNDKTPFLDKLKTAFENFGEEKEEKQRMRR